MNGSGFYRWSAESDSQGGSPEPRAPADDSSAGQTEPDAARRDGSLDIAKKIPLVEGLDPDRFEQYFEEYHDRILSFAFWKCGDHDVAADVTAETFLLAWDRRRQFRWQGYSLGAWLFQIARSLLSRQRRRIRTRREIEFEPERHDPVAADTPETELGRLRDRELIRRCLETLTDDAHEVVVLHHFLGMTTREIALVVRRPLGTVNSHLHRGKRALRRCLLDRGVAAGLSPETQAVLRRAAIRDAGLRLVDGNEEE